MPFSSMTKKIPLKMINERLCLRNKEYVYILCSFYRAHFSFCRLYSKSSCKVKCEYIAVLDSKYFNK